MRIRLSAQAIAAFCATIGIVTDVRAQGCVETFITDVDGNLYPVVTIGNQCWMGKDLITTRYNDGSDIPDGNVDIDTWNLMGTAAACDYQYGSQPDNLYGRLYNWYAATQPNICPLGWHVPTDAEWTDLAVYLGGPLVTGGKLKETGTLEGGNGLWYAPNTAATNESSFAARPTGARDMGFFDGFRGMGFFTSWWSATQSNSEFAWFRSVSYMAGDLLRNDDYKRSGYCLRCVLDQGTNGMSEQGQAHFTLGPNPTHSFVTIGFAPNSRPQNVSLLDAIGRTVSEQRTNTVSPITMDLIGLDDGLYFVLVDFADGTRAIERLVKE